MSSLRFIVEKFDPARKEYPLRLVDHDNEAELASAALPSAQVDGGPHSLATISGVYASLASVSPSVSEIGERLFAWLNQPRLSQAWKAARDAGSLTFLDVQDPDLSVLPWELLKAGNGYLFVRPKSPIVRFLTGNPVQDSTAPWPLRILVVAAVDNQHQKILTHEEAERLEQLLQAYGHSIDLHVLYDPDYACFREEFDRFRPHIFHFSGHCLLYPQVNQYGLYFAGPAPKYWLASEIDTMLATSQWCPRLVILNACRTADLTLLNSNRGIAAAFLDGGVQACIGMQGDLRGDLAGTFSGALFSKLAEGVPLESAVIEGRDAIITKTSDAQKDWSLPVLWRAAPGAIMPQPIALPADDQNRLTAWRFRTEIQMSADRHAERRSIRLRMEPVRPALPQRLILVAGEAESGKSFLSRCCAEAFTRWLYRVLHVQLVGTESLDLFSLLKLLRDAKPERTLNCLPAEAFYSFNWDCTNLRENGVTKIWDGSPANDTLEFDATKLKLDELRPLVCSSFLEALRAGTKDRKTLLILDEFSNSNVVAFDKKEFSQYIWPYLLQPIRDGKVDNLRVVMFMRGDDCDRYEMERWIDRKNWIELSSFSKNDFPRLIREYFWYASDSLPQLQKLIDAFGVDLGEHWPPSRLKDARTAADALFRQKEHMVRVGSRT